MRILIEKRIGLNEIPCPNLGWGSLRIDRCPLDSYDILKSGLNVITVILFPVAVIFLASSYDSDEGPPSIGG